MINDYKTIYSEDGIYGDLTYGNPGIAIGLKHAMMVCQGCVMKMGERAKVLVVGAGNGYEIICFDKYGHDVRGVEIYTPPHPFVKERTTVCSADEMPFADNEFDLVFCCEMMEHIPEHLVDGILNECKRVGTAFYFTIATRGDPPFNSHICVNHGEWWIAKFREIGFNILHAEVCPYLELVFGSMRKMKWKYSDGVMIYGRC